MIKVLEVIEEEMRSFVAKKGIRIGSKVRYTKSDADTANEPQVVDAMIFSVAPLSCVILELRSVKDKIIDVVVFNSVEDDLYFVLGIEPVEEDAEITQFSKNDLKDGMVVTYKSGVSRLVVDGELYRESKDIFYLNGSLDEYADDLCHLKQNNLDIIMVHYMGEVVWKKALPPEVELVTFEKAWASGKKIRYNKSKEGALSFVDAEAVVDWVFYKFSKEEIKEVLTMPVWEVEK